MCRCATEMCGNEKKRFKNVHSNMYVAGSLLLEIKRQYCANGLFDFLHIYSIILKKWVMTDDTLFIVLFLGPTLLFTHYSVLICDKENCMENKWGKKNFK